jgi:hypothetical protein
MNERVGRSQSGARGDAGMAGDAPRQLETGARSPSPRALVAVGAVAVLVICSCALLLRGQLNASLPDATARAFFAALSQHDFQTAYDLLTVDAQAQWARRGSGTGEQNFAEFGGSLDRVYGGIRHYEVGQVHVSGTRANTLVTVTRGGAPEFDLLVLARSGSGWAIVTFSPGVPSAAG